MKGRSSRRAEVWAAVTGDALEIRSWEGRRGARAATPLYEVPAALYARWGEEGDMPFFVRGVINVGFSPQLRNFVFKVAYYGFEFNGYTASLAGANPDCKVEQAALLRTLAIAQGSFPTHWRAWRSAVSAARSAGRAAATASGRGAAPGLGALWLLPAEADGAALGPQEAAMVAHPGWAEPPSAKCTQYTAALEAAVRALSRGGAKGLSYDAVWRYMRGAGGLTWSPADTAEALMPQALTSKKRSAPDSGFDEGAPARAARAAPPASGKLQVDAAPATAAAAPRTPQHGDSGALSSRPLAGARAADGSASCGGGNAACNGSGGSGHRSTGRAGAPASVGAAVGALRLRGLLPRRQMRGRHVLPPARLHQQLKQQQPAQQRRKQEQQQEQEQEREQQPQQQPQQPRQRQQRLQKRRRQTQHQQHERQETPGLTSTGGDEQVLSGTESVREGSPPPPPAPHVPARADASESGGCGSGGLPPGDSPALEGPSTAEPLPAAPPCADAPAAGHEAPTPAPVPVSPVPASVAEAQGSSAALDPTPAAAFHGGPVPNQLKRRAPASSAGADAAAESAAEQADDGQAEEGQALTASVEQLPVKGSARASADTASGCASAGAAADAGAAARPPGETCIAPATEAAACCAQLPAARAASVSGGTAGASGAGASASATRGGAGGTHCEVSSLAAAAVDADAGGKKDVDGPGSPSHSGGGRSGVQRSQSPSRPSYQELLRQNEELRRELELARAERRRDEAPCTAPAGAPAAEATAQPQADRPGADGARAAALDAFDAWVADAAGGAPPPPEDAQQQPLEYAKLLLYDAVSKALQRALDGLAASEVFQDGLRAVVTSEFQRQGPRLADPVLWRAAMRDALPAALEAAAPRLLQELERDPSGLLAALWPHGEGGPEAERQEALLRACVSRIAQDRGVSEGLEQGFAAAEEQLVGAMTASVGQLAASGALERRIEERVDALLPAALARWADAPAGAARVGAALEREARAALLAPAPVLVDAADATDATDAAPPSLQPPLSLLASELRAALIQDDALKALSARAVTDCLLRPMLPPGARVVVQAPGAPVGAADGDDAGGAL